jgi:type VI secretion system protein ImpJ
MTGPAGKLARVDWRMGMALLPEHLQAQEEALLANVELRMASFPAPLYGISELSWNEDLLKGGVLSLTSATLLMPSGRLVSIPGNGVSAPYNLDLLGVANIAVFCHLLVQGESDAVSSGGWQAELNAQVPRITYQLVLSTEQSQSGSLSSMRLADFVKAPDGGWKLSPTYVPPLSRLATSPFLVAELEEVRASVKSFSYRLLESSTSAPDGAGSFASKDCLFIVSRVQRLLDDLMGEIKQHPYYVYEALRDLDVAVSLYSQGVPELASRPYAHEDIGGCFAEVLGSLRDYLATSTQAAPYVPFVQHDGVLQTDIPEVVRTARQVFLLVQKTSATETLELRDLKLASPSRLAMVHRMALDGIPVRATARPPAAQAFGPEIEFFELGREDEWERALRQAVVGFYSTPEISDAGHRFFLYWVPS